MSHEVGRSEIELARRWVPREYGKSCPHCDSDLVYPVDWHVVADGRWELTLACPNCRWSGESLYRSDEIAQLEQRFEEGIEALLRDLRRLEDARAAEELERFVAALQGGHILPEDF
jgi:hypothetical protein